MGNNGSVLDALSLQKHGDLTFDSLRPTLDLSDTGGQKPDIADLLHLVDRHEDESQLFLGIDPNEFLIDNRLGNS